MKKRKTFDREFKQMVAELSKNRDNIIELALEKKLANALILPILKNDNIQL